MSAADRWCSVAAAAKALGVSPRTLRYRCATGAVPAQRTAPGRPWQVPTAWLAAEKARLADERSALMREVAAQCVSPLAARLAREAADAEQKVGNRAASCRSDGVRLSP